MDLNGTRIAYLCLQATTQGQASYAHVHEIVNGLEALGAKVDLFEPSYVGKPAPGPIGRLKEFARIQQRLKKELDAYDLVYIRSHALAKPTATAARKQGLPVIQECNGMVDDFFIAWPASRAFSPLITSWTLSQFREASAIIAGSNGLASWLKRETDRDAFIVPNGANIDEFCPVGRSDWPEHLKALDLPLEYAIFFGSLAPWQGIPSILEAATLPEWPKSVSLVIAGKGREAERVKASAGRHPNIRYIGELPYEELSPIVSGSLCSLVIKEQEAFAHAGISPLKLYESFACGVPVVGTTGMPGLTEVIEERDLGITVAQYDPPAIAQAVRRFHENPEFTRDMGRRARQFAETDGSWEMRGRETARVILEVLEG